ncbi:MAG TPA: site-specific DNA-methyltransferase [bacterium]|nr:site-specific DNA-methyltransferase [bacterium]
MKLNKIYNEDCLKTMKRMDDNFIDCVITSPPYWGLRDYGVDGQLGLEKTPEEYVQKMVQIFQEVRRVLKKEGTLWLNLGDSYGSGFSISDNKYKAMTGGEPDIKLTTNLKPKDMVGIPWRVAFALQADGWWLRSDIIWNKPNPMPESVTDRPTKAHEYIFLMSKSANYYYDANAIREDGPTYTRKAGGYENHKDQMIDGYSPFKGKGGFADCDITTVGRNKRTVWTIPTQPYPKAHFATYPEKLIEPCVLAGCPKEVCSKCGKAVERIVESYIEGIPRNEKGLYAKMNGKDGTCHYLSKTNIHGTKTNKTIGFKPSCNCNAEFVPGVAYDPFGGAMTTALVALRAERNFICSEISPEYCEIGEKRIRPYLDQYKLKL